MSDEELAQVSAATPGEERLFAAGCLGALVARPLLLFAKLALGYGILPFFVATLAVLMAIASAHRLLSRPRRGYREEWAYRSGQSAFSRYVDEAQGALGVGGADWSVLFTATALPHGDYRWLRLDVREGAPPSVRADLRLLARSAPLLKRTETDVSGEAASELLAMLRGLDMAALTSVPSFVYDGMPCNLAVLSGKSGDVKVAGCDLLGFDGEGQALHPTSRTCAKLLAFTMQLEVVVT